MRQFHRSVGTERRMTYADEVAAALRCDKVTVHLAADLEEATAALEAVWWERLQAQRELARARARVRVQDHALVETVRALHNAIQGATRVRGSALERDLFPKGLGPAIGLAGARFEQIALDLLEDLRQSPHDGAAEVRASLLARCEEELARFQAMLAARGEAEAALKRIRAEETKAREHTTMRSGSWTGACAGSSPATRLAGARSSRVRSGGRRSASRPNGTARDGATARRRPPACASARPSPRPARTP